MARIIRSLLIALIAGSGVTGTAAAQQGTDGTTLTFYAWIPKVLAEIPGGTEAVIDRDEIVENLDFAFAGEVLVERGPWLYGLDVFYADVGKSGSTTFNIVDGTPDGVDVEAVGDFTSLTTFVQGYAGYKVLEDPNGAIWGTAGVRYASFEQDLDVETESAAFSVGVTETVTDFTVGFRGYANVNEQIKLPFVVDFATGGSRFSFQVFGGASYRFGNNILTAGYRKIEWYLDDRGEFFERIEYIGPVLSYSYRF